MATPTLHSLTLDVTPGRNVRLHNDADANIMHVPNVNLLLELEEDMYTTALWLSVRIKHVNTKGKST